MPNQSLTIALALVLACSAALRVFATEMQQRLRPDEIAALPSFEAPVTTLQTQPVLLSLPERSGHKPAGRVGRIGGE